MKTMLVRSKNVPATEYYYNIISDGLKQCSELIFDGFDGEPLPDEKDAIVVVGVCTSMLRLWRQGYRRIITWHQGIIPEESYMRNKSIIRKKALEWVEGFALKNSIMQIFVSEAMREFFEEKYSRKILRYYTMPCFNAEYQPEIVNKKDYGSRIFTYTGGLSKWQCIDQTLSLYKRIEEASGNQTKLLLLTPEIEKAKELVDVYKIVNAEIKCVHYTQLSEELKKVTFGFALREDNPVNRVATPTKLANYVANGIIPIYASCVRDFSGASGKNPYQVRIEDVNSITEEEVQQILALMDQTISAKNAAEHFSKYFDHYYNAGWHAGQIADQISRLK